MSSKLYTSLLHFFAKTPETDFLVAELSTVF